MRDRPRIECAGDGGDGGGWVWTKAYDVPDVPDLAVVAVAPAGAGLEAVTGGHEWRTWAEEAREVTFPPHAVVIVLPSRQPRPAEDRERARTKAVLLTPVTVAADAVLYPSLVVWLVLFYRDC